MDVAWLLSYDSCSWTWQPDLTGKLFHCILYGAVWRQEAPSRCAPVRYIVHSVCVLHEMDVKM